MNNLKIVLFFIPLYLTAAKENPALTIVKKHGPVSATFEYSFEQIIDALSDDPPRPQDALRLWDEITDEERFSVIKTIFDALQPDPKIFTPEILADLEAKTLALKTKFPQIIKPRGLATYSAWEKALPRAFQNPADIKQQKTASK